MRPIKIVTLSAFLMVSWFATTQSHAQFNCKVAPPQNQSCYVKQAGETWQDANGNGIYDWCEGLSLVKTAASKNPMQISLATGGTQEIKFELGPDMAGAIYIIVGGFQTGCTKTPDGYAYVPLASDLYSKWLLKKILTNKPGLNEPEYKNFFFALDANGQATATITIPPGLNADPTSLHHAAVLLYYPGLASPGLLPLWSSNSVQLELVP